MQKASPKLAKKSNGKEKKQQPKSQPSKSMNVNGSHGQLVKMQKTYGNQFVQRMQTKIHRQDEEEEIQTKLEVGQPGDKFEQEADHMSEKVMRIPAPGLQTKQVVPQSHRQPLEEEEETIQTKKVNLKELAINRSVESQINSKRGSGQALPEATRAFFEPRFGADFSGVRVHNDSKSDALNNSLNARAFTTGQDIFFKNGEYNPNSSGGQKLLAHELAHVVQQMDNIILRKEFNFTKKSRIQSEGANLIEDYYYEASLSAIRKLDKKNDASKSNLAFTLIAFLPLGSRIKTIIDGTKFINDILADISKAEKDKELQTYEATLNEIRISLLKEVYSDRFINLVESNYKIFNQTELAIWHTIFPNTGFRNRSQLKQSIYASAIETIYQKAGGQLQEMVEVSRETTIAAIGKALIEFENWQNSWKGRRPTNKTIINHFNKEFEKAKNVPSKPAILGFGHGAFQILTTDFKGRLVVNPDYRKFFDEAVRIQSSTIRVNTDL